MFLLISLLVAAVAAQPTLTSRTATTLTFTYTPPANTSIVLVGLRRSTGTFVASVLGCTSAACAEFTCTSATVCAATAAGSEAWSSASLVAAANIFTATVDLTRGVDIRSGLPSVPLHFTTQTAGTNDAANVVTQMVTLTGSVANLQAYTNTAPSAGLITFSRPTMTELETTIVPATGQTVLMGWKASDMATLPIDGVICTLTAAAAAASTCVQYSCTGASACVASTTVLTKNTATDRSAIVVRPLTATLLNIENTMYVSYNSRTTPAGTINAATANGTSWSQYSVATPNYTGTTAPTFKIDITRPSDTTLGISAVPPANQTLYFGWRSAETVTWPADAVICAPSAVATCLDVSCTAAATCATRTTTIYTTNAASATGVSLVRALAAGQVPLKDDSKMNITYLTEATPAGTTTLTATSAQSRTWLFYTADVPKATSDIKATLPIFIASFCALLAIL